MFVKSNKYNGNNTQYLGRRGNVSTLINSRIIIIRDLYIYDYQYIRI